MVFEKTTPDIKTHFLKESLCVVIFHEHQATLINL